MTDLYRLEITARHSIQEHHDRAARERLARLAQASSREPSRSTNVEAHRGGLLSRLVPSFGHAV